MSTVVVLGMGVSGKGVAKLLLSQGHTVVGVEQRLTEEKKGELAPMIEQGVEVVEGLDSVDLKACAFAVASPGIPPHSPLYRTLEAAGVEVIGEANYCLRSVTQPVIAITGTNGKTTVTLLVEHVLKGAGRPARALGNVGASLGEYFSKGASEEIAVVELSSYQLYRFEQRVFDVGIVLNVDDDHLAWHGSMKDYALAKLQMGRCIKPGGKFFIPEGLKNEYEEFLKNTPFDTVGGEADEKIACNFPLKYRQLPKYEWENLKAAWLLTSHFSVTVEEFCSSVATFKKPEHRIEFVAQIDGVNYFNDSKGTNVSAVVAAVESMKGPTVLIAGGQDKGGSFRPWIAPFRTRVKRVIAIGEAAEKIQRELGSEIEVEVVGRMDRAVERAKEIAKEGENVLLSPGCASFDQYRDYRHRGEAFKQEIIRREKL